MNRKLLQGRDIGNYKRVKNGDFVISAESGREFGVFWNALKALSKRREHLKYFSKIEINEELRFSNLFTQQKSVGVLLLEREKESIEELKMLKKETKNNKVLHFIIFCSISQIYQ